MSDEKKNVEFENCWKPRINDRENRYFLMNWCVGPAVFPFNGKDHLVPCTLGWNHEGPCIPAQHQKHHNCETNGCEVPELIERFGLDREDQVQVRIMPKEVAEARRTDIWPPKQKRQM